VTSVLLHIVHEDIGIVAHDCHVEGEEELEARELGGSLEHLGDAVWHPVIRTSVQCKSVYASSLSMTYGICKVGDIHWISISQHEVGKYVLSVSLS
jgi:hypothetical protein